MPKRVKELMVEELEERFRDIKETGCVMVDVTGLSADESRLVRSGLRQQAGGRMMVVKNSLMRIALERMGAQDLEPLVDGPTAIVRADSAPAAARAVSEAAEEHPALTLKGGYAEGHLMDAAGIEKLAEIPPRDELLSMLAGAFLAPLRRLLRGMTAKQRTLANGLMQLRDRKREQQEDGE
ncbi:MAG: 50S ribosomal protein L10 [Candidatus Brocadiia bacterium]